jgi:hypothetical protein
VSDRILDLGSGFNLRFTSWTPDRLLNPQYDEIPSVDRIGAIVTCKHGIEGSILFSISPEHDALFPNSPHWTVESWEPLTLSPSIDTGCCHGFIKEGKWVE